MTILIVNKRGGTSHNTGFAVSIHSTQTAFGSFTKPGTVNRHCFTAMKIVYQDIDG